MEIGKRNFVQKHAIASKELKAEDVVFVHEDIIVGKLTWSLYCVCDGHGGVGAAYFVRQQLLEVLVEKLPSDGPLGQQKSKSAEDRGWANKIAKALASVFCILDETFAEAAAPSGTTISLALVCGSLLTVANVGDSEVFLDTGQDIFPMTECHKVDTSQSEQTRLRTAGATLSACLTNYMTRFHSTQRPVGPLRVWPGGIAVSRSLGDFECSRHVISNAHIKQVVLPKAGARLILATDGLWDHVSGKKACKLSRSCTLSRAPTRLFRALMSSTRNCLVDDTTILVIDFLPKETEQDFPTMCKLRRSKGSVWLKLKQVLNHAPLLKSSKRSSIYSSIDTAVAFPQIISRGHEIYHATKSQCRRSLSRHSSSYCKRSIALYNEETNRWSEEGKELIEISKIES